LAASRPRSPWRAADGARASLKARRSSAPSATASSSGPMSRPTKQVACRRPREAGGSSVQARRRAPALELGARASAKSRRFRAAVRLAEPGFDLAADSLLRRSDFFTAGKLVPNNLGLLQHYRHSADEPGYPHSRRVLEGKRTIRKPTSQEEASRCGSAVDLPSSRRGRNYLLVN